MEDITFSDSVDLTDNTELVFAEGIETGTLSFEDYCRRFPDAAECLEYDV
jgi:hypothetical protein